MKDRDGRRLAKRDGQSRRPAPRATYRSLGSRGLAPAEAGNLTAFLHGLRPAVGGWTVREINGLLFLRSLVERGRLPS
jgi:hypothetical protein